MNKFSSDSDEILKRLFDPKPTKVKESLEDLFLDRLDSLDIPKTTALNIMGMSLRTLDGIISGEQKNVRLHEFDKVS